MKRTLTYTIENETTVLDFLKRHGYSHSVITHLKRTPYSILGNGKWLYVNDRLMPGDTLTIHLIEEESSTKIPRFQWIWILYTRTKISWF